jgi:hypothetical protein
VVRWCGGAFDALMFAILSTRRVRSPTALVRYTPCLDINNRTSRVTLGTQTKQTTQQPTTHATDTTIQHNNAIHQYSTTALRQHNNTTTQQHNNTTNTTLQQYNNTTIQQYNNTTIRQHDNTTIQQYNNTTRSKKKEKEQENAIALTS